MNVDDFLDDALTNKGVNVDSIDLSGEPDTPPTVNSNVLVASKDVIDPIKEEEKLEVPISQDISNMDINAKLKSLLNSGNLLEASIVYDKLVESIEGTAKGDLEKNLKINKLVIQMHENYSRVISKHLIEANKKCDEINTIISFGIKKLKDNNFESAKKDYILVLDIIQKIPKGITEKRDEVLSNFIRFKYSFEHFKTKLMKSEFVKLSSNIKNLISDCDSNLKLGNIDQALINIEDAEKIYSKIPKELILEKIKIREILVNRKNAVLLSWQINHLQKEFNLFKSVKDDIRVTNKKIDVVENNSRNMDDSPAPKDEKKTLENNNPAINPKEVEVGSKTVTKKDVDQNLDAKVEPTKEDITISDKIKSSQKKMIISMIKIDLMMNNFDEALERIKSAQETFPGDLDVLELKKEFLQKTNSNVNSTDENNPSVKRKEVITNDLEESEKYLKKKIALCNFNLKKGNTNKALDICKDLVTKYPDNHLVVELQKKLEVVQ